MSAEPDLIGGCLCGDVRYQADNMPFAAEYCHCGMCRKSAGAPAVAWMDFRVEEVTWTQGEPLEYQSSEAVFRGFCRRCGTTLTFRDSRHPEYLSLSIGSLDEPDRVSPTYHIYTDDQIEWFKIDDEHPRFAEGPEKT